MAIEALLELLEREARAQADAVAAAARDRVAELEARTAAEAERRRAMARSRLEAEARDAERRSLAAAARRHREELLAARAAALDRVFAAAAVRLATLPVERYRERIPDLVRSTLPYLEGAPAVLEVRRDAAPLLSAAAGGSVRVVSREDAPAGLRGRSEDGRVVVDNTLPARLARLAPDLAIGLAARIEGG